MRQLFRRTRVLLPLLALLAVPAEGFGQTWGRPWSQSTDSIPAEKMPDTIPAAWTRFMPVTMVAPTIISSWNATAANDARWNGSGRCQEARGYVRDAIQRADIQVGFGSPNLAGEYFGPLTETSTTNDADVIAIHFQFVSTGGGFGTLIEEAWHRSTGDSDSIFSAISDSLKASSTGIDIQECHEESNEEDDECEASGDKAADCTPPPPPPPTPTPKPKCETKAKWVTTTKWVWVEVWESEWVEVEREWIPHANVWQILEVEIKVDNGYWKEVSTRELQTYTECSPTN